jgi:hypothetical protein
MSKRFLVGHLHRYHQIDLDAPWPVGCGLVILHGKGPEVSSRSTRVSPWRISTPSVLGAFDMINPIQRALGRAAPYARTRRNTSLLLSFSHCSSSFASALRDSLSSFVLRLARTPCRRCRFNFPTWLPPRPVPDRVASLSMRHGINVLHLCHGLAAPAATLS